MPRLVHTATLTARKPYCCGRCGGLIQRGERYLRHSASPGGEMGLLGWAHERECAGCAEKFGRPVDSAAAP